MSRTERIRVDAALCRDCQACTLACSLSHEGCCDPGLARLVVAKDMATYTFDIRYCHHCEAPDCVAACPTGALALDARRSGARGVAILRDDACSRCGACADACPYRAIFYHQAADRYLKCDLCAGQEQGPWCAAMCAVGAITLEDAPSAGGNGSEEP